MNARVFSLPAAAYGIPTREELVSLRMWDTHFHGMYSEQPIEQYERNNFYAERMGIERSICLELEASTKVMARLGQLADRLK